MSPIRPAQILIVNTEPEVTGLLFSRLIQDGHLVKSSTSPQEAIALIEAEEFHLVLLQARLPGMSGLELKQEIRKRRPLLPVIVSENFKSIRDSDDVLRFGASDFILAAGELASLASRLAGGKQQLEGRLYANPDVQNFVTNMVLTFTELLGRVVPALGPNQAEKRVLATSVARHLGVPEATIADIGIAAMIYDVGKVKISDLLLRKEDDLRPHEEMEIRNHCHWSNQIVERLGLPPRIQQVVLHHHEYYDGSGYPEGLRGRAIPIGSRILCVVDSFFAMISPRPYREPLSESEALAELNRTAGAQFDPEVVEHFVRVVEERFIQEGESFRKDIVVVDDDPGSLELLRLNFEQEGFTVRCFDSAKEALSRLTVDPPSLILADVMMPEMSGFEFLRKLRKHIGLRSVPFIFVSGTRVNEHDRVRGLDIGADDYLVKPFRVNELNSKVRAVLRRRQGTRTAIAKTQGIVGNVRDLSLPDIIQLLYHGRKTAVIELRRRGSRARIFIENGNVVHASLTGLGAAVGKEAFETLVSWRDAHFLIRHGVTSEQHTIQTETAELVLQSLVDLDAKRAGGPGG